MVSLRKISRPSLCERFFQIPKSNSLEPASRSHALEFAIFEQFRVVTEFKDLAIRRTLFLFLGKMHIIRLLAIFVDLHATFINRDVSRSGVDPGSAIVVIDSVFLIVLVQGGVGVSAKDARGVMMTGVRQGAVGNLGRQALPARAQPVEKTGQGFIFGIPFLQLEIKERADQIANVDILDDKSVELMTVGCDMAQAVIFPLIFLVHADA